MSFNLLNPFVRKVSLYERAGQKNECVAYDSRLIYMLSGDITVTVSGKKLGHISPGHLLYIPSGTPYKLKSNYFRAVVIDFDLTADMPSEDRLLPVTPEEFNSDMLHPSTLVPFDKLIHLEELEGDRDVFTKMADIFTSAEGLYRVELSAMLKSVLVKIAETVDENALPSRMVEALGEYIRENVGDEISNTELGAIFGYHPFYISKVMKDRKGITLRQYVISYRLKLARKMLEDTERSINQIAEECGFTDASYFTKTFKNAFGMTPKDYRNKYKDVFI